MLGAFQATRRGQPWSDPDAVHCAGDVEGGDGGDGGDGRGALQMGKQGACVVADRRVVLLLSVAGVAGSVHAWSDQRAEKVFASVERWLTDEVGVCLRADGSGVLVLGS